MGIGVNIELDAAAIAKLEAAALPAAQKTIDELKTDVVTAQVMPFDMGDMQNNQTFVTSEGDEEGVTVSLVTGSPQARRLYFNPEYNFQKVNNPNAGGEWLEPWLNGEKKDFVEDTFVENYKKEAGV